MYVNMHRERERERETFSGVEVTHNPFVAQPLVSLEPLVSLAVLCLAMQYRVPSTVDADD